MDIEGANNMKKGSKKRGRVEPGLKLLPPGVMGKHGMNAARMGLSFEKKKALERIFLYWSVIPNPRDILIKLVVVLMGIYLMLGVFRIIRL